MMSTREIGRSGMIRLKHSSLLRVAAIARRFAFVALCAPVALGACGSDGGGANDRVCAPGASQACVTMSAAGQCDGAQTCNTEGSSWSACMCGGAGGSSGSAGSAGASASGGSSGSSGGTGGNSGSATGGVGGSSGSAGSGPAGAGGSADAGSDASVPKQPGPLDDPCPDPNVYPFGIDLNCSDQCVASDVALCSQAQCWPSPLSGPPPQVIFVGEPLPWVIRLPANPPMSCSCSGTKTYTITFRVTTTEQVKFVVGKPWRIMTSAETPACTGVGGKKGCHGPLPAGTYDVTIGTDDANAPSANVAIGFSNQCYAAEFWE